MRDNTGFLQRGRIPLGPLDRLITPPRLHPLAKQNGYVQGPENRMIIVLPAT